MTEIPERLVEVAAKELAWVKCACGHVAAQHDPEDGRCDAGALPPCHCIALRSGDPDVTLRELQARAVLSAVFTELEQVGWIDALGRPSDGDGSDDVPVYRIRERNE